MKGAKMAANLTLTSGGTDVTIIQKIMGHNDIRTNMRYLQTSNKDLLKILSPLDSLNLYIQIPLDLYLRWFKITKTIRWNPIQKRVSKKAKV